MLTKNPPGGRGCGTRKEGGTYLCCGTSPYGQPIEHFLKDPGWVWEHELSRAPTLLPDKNGIYHVYLLIGEGAYKSAWFHIEETRHFGLSRLVSPTLQWDLLTPYASTIRCIYPRGIPKFDFEGNGDQNWYPDCKVKERWDKLRENDLVDDAEDWDNVRLGNHPTDNPEHRPCIFAQRDLSYFLASKDQVTDDLDDDNPAGEFTIEFPSKNNASFEYSGDVPFVDDDTDLHDKDNWYPAVLLEVPLTHIEMPKYENEHADKIRELSDFDIVVTPY